MAVGKSNAQRIAAHSVNPNRSELRESFDRLSSGIRANATTEICRPKNAAQSAQAERALRQMSDLALGLSDLARQAADAYAPFARGRLMRRAVAEVIEAIEMNLARLDTTLENI